MSGSTHDPQVWDSDAQTNTNAVATFDLSDTQRAFLTKVIFSASGTIAAAVRATIVWTKDTVEQTIGIQIPTTLVAGGALSLDFSTNPLEADPGSTVTVTLPALGGSGVGETVLLGWLEDI